MNLVAKNLINLAGFAVVLGATTGPAFCQQLVINNTSLPPCNMDSFVYQAGAQAEMIYGDEGTTDIPPLFGFTQASRINAGITGVNDAGLTTGHGSYMPSAWGADEFLCPPGEWDLSGANYGNEHYNNAAAGLDAADQASKATAAAQQAQSAAASQALLSSIYATDGGAAVAGPDGSDAVGGDNGSDPDAYQGGTSY